MGTSVIRPAIAGCCDHNGFLTGGYRQGSRKLCDRVVAFFVAFAFNDLNGIGYRFSCLESASGCLCSCFSFYKTVSVYCYIRSGQCCSVISFAGSLTGQGYLSRADRKLSVFDLEGYVCKVGVVVREIFRFQLHVVASGVGSLHFCVSAEREVCFFIQRIADALHNVTSRTMLDSVVFCTSAVLGDRYGHFIRYRSDAQFTFVLLDLIVAVFVCFCLFDLDAVDCRAIRYVGHTSGCLCSCFSINKTVSTYCYFRFGQRCSVINLAAACTGQGYRSRADRQASVLFYYYLDGAVVKRSCGKVFGCQTHRIDSCIRSACLCLFSFIQGYGDTLWSICGKVGYFMALTIITYCIAVSGDRYGQFIRFLSDGQGSRNCCDLIVFRHILLVCQDLYIFGCGDRSLILSCIRSFCFRCHIMCMIIQKSFCCYSGQCLEFAIIRLAAGFAGKGYLSRSDLHVCRDHFGFPVLLFY